MHLHAPEIHRYLERDLDERTLAVVDAHVRVSLPWTESLAQHAMEHACWERRGLLGRLVRVDAPRDEVASAQAQPQERAEAA
jgi:hypothetical protein